MRDLLRKFSLFIAIFFAQQTMGAQAQTFAAIGYGSKFVCAQMSVGSNQLFRAGGNISAAISVRRAIRSVSKDISKLQARLQRLNKIRLRTRSVRRLISKTKSAIKNKKREIAAIRDCGRGSTASTPISGTLTYEQVKLRGLNGFYVATVMYLPRQTNSSFWYCIRGPWQTEGEPRLFSNNPCSAGWPSVSRNDCSQLTPSSTYTSIYASRLFLGPNWDANSPHITAAVEELEQFYSGNIVGRPRTSAGDDCKVIR